MWIFALAAACISPWHEALGEWCMLREIIALHSLNPACCWLWPRGLIPGVEGGRWEETAGRERENNRTEVRRGGYMKVCGDRWRGVQARCSILMYAYCNCVQFYELCILGCNNYMKIQLNNNGTTHQRSHLHKYCMKKWQELLRVTGKLHIKHLWRPSCLIWECSQNLWDQIFKQFDNSK